MVDTTKCPIVAPKEEEWHYLVGSSKFALKYEIGVSFGVSSRIVWVSGPWKGAAADPTILRTSGLLEALPKDEALLADKIYKGLRHRIIVPRPGKFLNAEGRAYNFLVYSARQTVERAIRRIKNSELCRSTWRSSIALHKLCFMAQCKLTNWFLIFEPMG